MDRIYARWLVWAIGGVTLVLALVIALLQMN